MENYLFSLARDFRYALRNHNQNLRFSLLAIFALALGIGACTVIFSVVYNVFFHALPYKDFNRSVVFEIRNTGSVGESKRDAYFSANQFRAFREENHVFEDMIAHGTVGRLFYDDGKFTRVLPSGAAVTTNTFDYLGIPPLLGRTISEQDGQPGAPPVFVMNYRLWQREFGADPTIIGKTFILRDTPRILVGIMPPRFNAFGASLWIPVRSDHAEDQPDLYRCPRCGGPMKVIERLTAAEILFRSPPGSGQPHETNVCHPNISAASRRFAPFCLAAKQILGGSLA